MKLDGYITNDKDKYTFHFEGGLLTAVRYDSALPYWIIDEKDYDELDGKLINGSAICFLKGTIRKGDYFFTSRPAAVIVGDNYRLLTGISKIDAIEFSGPLVDDFYPPLQRLVHDCDSDLVKFKDKSDVTKTYSVATADNELFVEFSIERLKPLELHSSLRIRFKTAISPSAIIKHYVAVRNLLSLAHFRKDVPLTTLNIECLDGAALRRTGTMTIYGIDDTSQFKLNRNSIKLKNIDSILPGLIHSTFDDSFPFEQIRSNQKDPVSKRDIVSVASGFESAFEKLHPQNLSAKDPVFHDVKTKVLAELKRLKAQAKSEGKDTTMIHRIKRAVEVQENTLIEKLRIASQEFKFALFPALVLRLSILNIKWDDLGNVFISFKEARDDAAHGKPFQISDEIVLGFVIVRLLVFSQFFKRLGMSDDDIKANIYMLNKS